MIPAHVVRQNDFSAGQVSETALRSDDKGLVQAALRMATNTRLRGTGPLDQRPGRMVQFLGETRADYVRMSSTTRVVICFSAGTVTVRSTSGAVQKTQGGLPWTDADVANIVIDRAGNTIYIWFPGIPPKVLTWNGGTSWGFSTFNFALDGQGRRQEPFFRFADTAGITLSVSALTGTGINIVFSDDVLTSDHIGFRFRYCDRQIEIKTVVDGQNGTADVIEELPPAYTVAVGSSKGYNVGDAVEGSSTGTTGVVLGVTDSTHIVVQIKKNFAGFASGDKIVGPFASSNFSSQVIVSDPTDYPITIWDEAACSTVRGWPQSGFSDQNRLGMCDLPGIPNGIMWSAIAAYDNFLPGSEPESAMLERLNSPDRVYHVVGGPDEFVLTDRGVKYIPISEANPLKPGSVAFRDIGGAPSSAVRPLSTSDGVVYVDAARGRLVGIAPTGQTAQPYITRDVSEFHAALFNSPVCLAGTTGDSDIPERYIYVLNEDGTMAVGRVDAGKDWVGWVPWDGEGAVKWLSGLDNELLLSTLYDPDAAAAVYVIEKLSTSAYLDGQVSYNSLPSGITANPGPLSWLAGATVHVMDGRRYLGTRIIDADGYLTPEEGEVFTDPDIIAGFSWTSTVRPFIRHAPAGQSTKQTLRRRKIKKVGVHVQNSMGFMCAGRRIPPWVQGEDQAGQPPLREGAYFFRVSGRAVDPVVDIVRDIPGSLRINEISYEVTV